MRLDSGEGHRRVISGFPIMRPDLFIATRSQPILVTFCAVSRRPAMLTGFVVFPSPSGQELVILQIRPRPRFLLLPSQFTIPDHHHV